MTIAMVTTLPPYALVAADSLYRGLIWEEGGDQIPISGHHTKVWVHPSLPIAVASAGIAVLGAEPTSAVIHRALTAPITGRPSEVIGERLRDVLQPLVDAELALGAYENDSPEHAVVQVFIAVSEGGRAGAAVLTVGRTSSFEPVRNAISPPKSAAAAYAGKSAEVLFGRYIKDPLRLAEHMRRRIKAGVAESERQLGTEAEAGGQVDVALVGPDGARIVPAATKT